MTPFEKNVQDAKARLIKVPKVTTSDGTIDFFKYQLAVHKYNLGIMSMGMKCRGVTFTDIKKYYGLKGRSAKACKPQLEEIIKNFK